MKRLTPVMRRKLVPFLPKLIWRFRYMVRHSAEPESECPLCTEARRIVRERRFGRSCDCCPVFGLACIRSKDSAECVMYMPEGWGCHSEIAQRVLDFLLDLQKKAKEGKV